MGQRLLRTLSLAGVFVLATVDLLVRVVGEVPIIGDTVLVPALAVLTTRMVIDAQTLGWGLGWTLLGVTAFWFTPYLFPQQYSRWASGLPIRLSVALSATVTAIGLEAVALRRVLEVGSVPVPVSAELIGPAIICGTVGLTLSQLVPPVGNETALLTPSDSSTVVLPPEQWEQMSGFSIVARGTILICLLALLLTTASILFPLPELLVIAIVVSDTLNSLIAGLPQQRDVVESIAYGATAVWGGVSMLTNLVVCVVALSLIVWFELRLLRLSTLPVDTPVAAAGAIAFFLAMTTTALYYIRLIERFPAWISAKSVEVRPRIPGFLLPASVLFLFSFREVIQAVQTSGATTTAIYMILVGSMSTLALVTTLVPQYFPRTGITDEVAIPLSMSVVAVGFATQTETTVSDGIVGTLLFWQLPSLASLAQTILYSVAFLFIVAAIWAPPRLLLYSVAVPHKTTALAMFCFGVSLTAFDAILLLMILWTRSAISGLTQDLLAVLFVLPLVLGLLLTYSAIKHRKGVISEMFGYLLQMNPSEQNRH